MPAPSARPASFVPLAGYYLLYFGSIGVTLPYLPAYLKSLHFTATEVGALLAIGPTLAIFAPPIWGALADRSGRPDRVLRMVSFGAALGFLPLLWASGYAAVFATLVAFSMFHSSISTLVDSVALHRVSMVGGQYSHLRMFGSFGFILASLGFGLSTPEFDRRTIVWCVCLMSAYALWSLSLHAPVRVGIARRPFAGLRMLGERDIALMLTATALHWIASAPYHATFSIHVDALGLPPWVVGAATSAGVVAEVLVLVTYPRFGERIAPRYLLALSFGVSALRWVGVAWATGPLAIASLQLLHALTFGTFYVASVAFMARRVPPELRASGQALFVAMTFGIGGLVGYLSAGAGYDLLGGPRLFLTGAALEIVAALIVLQVGPPGAPVGISAPAGRRTA